MYQCTPIVAAVHMLLKEVVCNNSNNLPMWQYSLFPKTVANYLLG